MFQLFFESSSGPSRNRSKFINVYSEFRDPECFNSFLSPLQALQETDPSLSMFTVNSGIPNAYNRWYSYCKSACTFAIIVPPIVSVRDPGIHCKHWWTWICFLNGLKRTQKNWNIRDLGIHCKHW